jgi:hypothetical protein
MNILVLNAGSGSHKCSLFRVENALPVEPLEPIWEAVNVAFVLTFGQASYPWCPSPWGRVAASQFHRVTPSRPDPAGCISDAISRQRAQVKKTSKLAEHS